MWFRVSVWLCVSSPTFSVSLAHARHLNKSLCRAAERHLQTFVSAREEVLFLPFTLLLFDLGPATSFAATATCSHHNGTSLVGLEALEATPIGEVNSGSGGGGGEAEERRH